MRTELGKIQTVRVGMGGYQDAMFGVWLTIGGKAWGVTDGKGTWATRDENAKYSEQEHRDEYAKTFIWAQEVCKQAKVQEIADLQGVPVECTFEGNQLKSWRVLEEVI